MCHRVKRVSFQMFRLFLFAKVTLFRRKPCQIEEHILNILLALNSYHVIRV